MRKTRFLLSIISISRNENGIGDRIEYPARSYCLYKMMDVQSEFAVILANIERA